VFGLVSYDATPLVFTDPVLSAVSGASRREMLPTRFAHALARAAGAESVARTEQGRALRAGFDRLIIAAHVSDDPLSKRCEAARSS